MNFTREEVEILNKAVLILSKNNAKSKWTLEHTQTVYSPKDFVPHYKIKIDGEIASVVKTSTLETEFAVDMGKNQK